MLRELIILVDYSFYTDIYRGKSISDPLDFDRMLFKALSLIRQHTFNRVDYVEDDLILNSISLALCELVELENDLKSLQSSGNIRSETMAKESFTYFEGNSSGVISDFRSSQYEIIYRHLINTGLMYRGV